MLTAFLSGPAKHSFQAELKPLAYIDEDMQVAPAANGNPARYIMEPSPLAKLLQLQRSPRTISFLRSAAAPVDAAALLSLLAGSVVAVESDEARCCGRPKSARLSSMTMLPSSQASSMPAIRRSAE